VTAYIRRTRSSHRTTRTLDSSDSRTNEENKENEMKRPGRLVVVATAVAVAGLGGGGVAMAQSAQHAPRPAAGTEPTSPDTDTLQQGDQTTPDRAVTAVHPAAVHGVTAHQRTAATAHRAEGPENGPENETEVDQNDGPGGHQDPPGDVQHEGGADEP
jgi:hypothetical protein